MPLLNREEIIQSKIVQKDPSTGASATAGLRATTYDSTIGEIFGSDGNKVKNNTYMLAPRGIAWIVSAETYCMPQNVTGITTLKTDWTKKGILTLTVGIVDPGYKGSLSTAVINFSNTDFEMTKGERFFRTAFFSHEESPLTTKKEVSRKDYEEKVHDSTNRFSDTFLNVNTLAEELTEKMFALPRWAFKISIIGLVIGISGILISFIFDVGKNVSVKDAKIEMLEERLQNAEDRLDVLEP